MAFLRARWLVVCGGLAAVLAASTLAAGVALTHWPSGAPAEGRPARPGKAAVKTIRPKYSPSFVRSVKEPAYVEPYYRADLYAHVAGVVKYIEKNIGDRVSRGELLVEIDVPDLIQEIAQKEALIQQAIADRDQAAAAVRTQQEAVATARLRIPEKQAAVEEAVATRELREDELRRYEILAKRQATTGDIVEERKKDLKAATAAGKSAELAVDTARSELRLAEAKLEAARADLKVKEVHIAVAREDKARVEAQADFARIRAPFDATIVARHVDPGSFVQNATTAHTEPFLSLVRLDLVTVSMKAPEKPPPS